MFTGVRFMKRRVIAHTRQEGGKWVLNNGLLPPKPAAILFSDGLIFDFNMFSDPPIRRFPHKSKTYQEIYDRMR